MTISLALKFLLLGQLASKSTCFRTAAIWGSFFLDRAGAPLICWSPQQLKKGMVRVPRATVTFLGVPWNCNLLVIDHRKTFPKPKTLRKTSPKWINMVSCRPVFMLVTRFFPTTQVDEWQVVDQGWMVIYPENPCLGPSHSIHFHSMLRIATPATALRFSAVGYIANRSADWIDWIPR